MWCCTLAQQVCRDTFPALDPTSRGGLRHCAILCARDVLRAGGNGGGIGETFGFFGSGIQVLISEVYEAREDVWEETKANLGQPCSCCLEVAAWHQRREYGQISTQGTSNTGIDRIRSRHFSLEYREAQEVYIQVSMC